jgi:diguanylate cyclase (GGDEF)-like protein
MASSNMRNVRYFRRPWYWLVALALVAIGVSLLVIENGRAQYAQNQREFEASRDLRLQRIEQRVDEFFMESIQIASFGARTLDDARGNMALTRELTLAMLASRHHREIVGVGAFFAPYQFDSRYRLVGIYERVAAPGQTAGEVFFERNAIVAARDYTGFSWYRRAAANPGQTMFAGPYTHVRSFISTVHAFSANGRLAGVVVVDTLTVEFKALMASAVAPGDVAWIESSRGNGHDLVATAVIPPGPRVDRRIPLRYTGAFLHLSTDATPLERARQNELSSVIGLLGAVWLVTAVIALGLMQRWGARERQKRLEDERKRLEDEIAMSKTVEAELRKAAYTDSLTGLPNRAAFLDFVQSILGSGNGNRYAIFFIDLDRFNIVNETLGHLAGDELLRAVGKRLETVMESTDLVARLGGDEFVIVASIESRSFAEAASLLLAHLSEPILLSGRTIYPEASMGVVAIDASYTSPEDLLRDADIAMYAAKNGGRAQFAIFDAAMRQRIAEESQLEHDLRRAIEHGELLPYYQPIVDTVTRRIVAFEALARWHRRDGRIVTASEFMHFAESRGFVEAVDSLMFRSVCAHATSIFSSFPDAVISVNVSAADLTSQVLEQTMEPLMQQHGLHPARLKLEITETAMMTSSETTLKAIERLRRLGLEFVLDDFGTGYSSLAYLQRLPIGGIKIDRSFVEPLLSDQKAVEIVRSIVTLARSFGLSTTAEGVETQAHFELLADLGVDHAQGFFISPAVEISGLIKLRQLKYVRPNAASE